MCFTLFAEYHADLIYIFSFVVTTIGKKRQGITKDRYPEFPNSRGRQFETYLVRRSVPFQITVNFKLTSPLQ